MAAAGSVAAVDGDARTAVGLSAAPPAIGAGTAPRTGRRPALFTGGAEVARLTSIFSSKGQREREAAAA